MMKLRVGETVIVKNLEAGKEYFDDDRFVSVICSANTKKHSGKKGEVIGLYGSKYRVALQLGDGIVQNADFVYEMLEEFEYTSTPEVEKLLKHVKDKEEYKRAMTLIDKALDEKDEEAFWNVVNTFSHVWDKNKK
ncbi:IDEAL domain-containing protein [Priestia aryabhattai]|uniref:hypothetical protein n=1 Tax=Priestia aryabhattai TaxID=412384 RepID=UPI0039A33761